MKNKTVVAHGDRVATSEINWLTLNGSVSLISHAISGNEMGMNLLLAAYGCRSGEDGD